MPSACRSTTPAATSWLSRAWGREDHVRALLGDRVSGATSCRQTVSVDRFTRPEAFCDYFKAHYGPTVAAYRAVAEDPDRVAVLDDDLAELARRHGLSPGKPAMEWEDLLFTARTCG